MLNQIDLSRKVSRDDYKLEKEPLEKQLARLQREAIELKIPIIVVFEGWSGSGKGTLINRLILNLDPRRFSVHTINPPTEEERFRPYLWRFWTKTPARGRMTIFDRSWYNELIYNPETKKFSESEWQQRIQEINSFERQLADSGCLILKFFLHISKDEQKRRFDKLLANDATSWRITKTDWKKHRKYNTYIRFTEMLLSKTDSEYAPWRIVEANNRRFAVLKIFKRVVEAVERKVNEVRTAQSAERSTEETDAGMKDMQVSILSGIDLSKTIERPEYVKQLDAYQNRIRELEHEVYKRRMPVVICYEGWDAAGKGGNIRRVTGNLDPRGYDVIPIAAPNDIEKRHHYLWRFWKEIPKAGHIAIFDRTWYGRVMVERVEGFCSATEWKRAYREINEFEEQLVNYGTVLVKFWLHIDQEEQLQRFQLREKDPDKQWKLTEEDWRNREKWDVYLQAVDEMLFRTSTPLAPWTIIEANSKYFARLKALKTVIDAIEAKLAKK